MMLTMDRNDPAMRAAMDQAARVAEHILDQHNDDAAQELALDVLNDHVDDLYWGSIHGRKGPDHGLRVLAWAFSLTERRSDLKPYEEKLLELAWERVRDDLIKDEWEAMGR